MPGGLSILPAGLPVARLLVECFLGDAEGVHCRRHPAVEHHLRDDLRDFLLGHADMKGAGDVPLDHLRAVSQDDQSGDGAEAAGFKVNGGPVVNLAVDHRVHQPHHLRGQFGHGRRGLRVVIRPVVAYSEIGGGLLQVYHLFFIVLILVFRPLRQVRLVRAQIWILEFAGHGVHLPIDADALAIESASSGGLPSAAPVQCGRPGGSGRRR